MTPSGENDRRKPAKGTNEEQITKEIGVASAPRSDVRLNIVGDVTYTPKAGSVKFAELFGVSLYFESHTSDTPSLNPAWLVPEATLAEKANVTMEKYTNTFGFVHKANLLANAVTVEVPITMYYLQGKKGSGLRKGDLLRRPPFPEGVYLECKDAKELAELVKSKRQQVTVF